MNGTSRPVIAQTEPQSNAPGRTQFKLPNPTACSQNIFLPQSSRSNFLNTAKENRRKEFDGVIDFDETPHDPSHHTHPNQDQEDS